MQNTRIILAQRPLGHIHPSDFTILNETIAEPRDGEILIRQTHMSLDPAMRAWMDDSQDGYMPAVELGDTMRSFGIGVVESSNLNDFPVGTRVSGSFGWTKYCLSNGSDLAILPEGIPEEHFLALLGIPGATAYHGLMELVGAPKVGETILISAAAGSVGSLVGQIAKAEGMKVIGITSTEEKRRWLEDDLGFDATINHKTESLDQQLQHHAPDGIDMLFENVGGESLSTSINHMKNDGRIALCGLISTYNDTKDNGGPSLINAIIKRLTLRGFVIADQQPRFPEIFSRLNDYVEKGKIQYRLDWVEGLEQAPIAINRLFDGSNVGKLAIKL